MKRQLVLGLAAAAAIVALAPGAARAAGNLTCTAQMEPVPLAVSDSVAASAECVSTDTPSYTLAMTVTIQELRGGLWTNACGSVSRTGTVVEGVGVIAPFTVSCPAGTGGEFRRAHAVLTNSVDGVPRSFDSATWTG